MGDNTARRFGAEPPRFGRRIDAPIGPSAPVTIAPRVTSAAPRDEPSLPKQPAAASPEQRSTRDDDLRAFFGPNAAAYLLIYRAWQKTSPAPEQSILFWHRPFFRAAFWNGFTLFIPWLFYRKLYGIGTAVLLGTAAIQLLAPSPIAGALSFVIGMFFVRYGQQLYIDQALRRVDKADELGFTGAAREAYLRRIGGRSLAAAIAGSAMSSLIAGLFFLPS